MLSVSKRILSVAYGHPDAALLTCMQLIRSRDIKQTIKGVQAPERGSSCDEGQLQLHAYNYAAQGALQGRLEPRQWQCPHIIIIITDRQTQSQVAIGHTHSVSAATPWGL